MDATSSGTVAVPRCCTAPGGLLVDFFVPNVADEPLRGVLMLAQTRRDKGGHAAECDRCCTSWLCCS
jgi:hypothetical protein